MATVNVLNPANIITEATDHLMLLNEKIFKARDFSLLEKQIADASKIRLGLKALTTLTADEIEYQNILIGLNKLCKIYR